MTEQEEYKLMEERIIKFRNAIVAANLQDIPHIIITFDDATQSCICGATPHFQDIHIRMQILLDLLKKFTHELHQKEHAKVNEALLMNLFAGRAPVA